MVADSSGIYMSVADCHGWLRRFDCAVVPDRSTATNDYWRTSTGIVFPVARPEATAGGKRSIRDGKSRFVYDRAYVMDLINHVLGLYNIATARAAAGDVLAGEPPLRIVAEKKH